MRSIAAGLVEALGELVEVLRRRAELRRRACPGPGSAAARGSAPGGPRSSASPRLGKDSRDASASVPCALIRRPRSGAAAPRSVSSGVPWSARPSRSTISRRSFAQEAGQQVEPRRDVAAALGGGLAGLVGDHDEVREVLALARQRRERLSESRASRTRRPVLLGQDGQHLVGLLQRRVGAVDDLVEVLAAAGEAGAQLAQQDREALPVGQPQDVVEQVEVDRRARVLRPAAGARPRRRRARSSRAGGRWSMPGSHSTKRSPIRPWRRIGSSRRP